MKLGIIQGRLTTPIDNKIQEFPLTTWQKEFDLLEKLNLNHIEWIITTNCFENNPFFFNDLTKHKISSVCCDHIINNSVDDFNFLQNKLGSVCEFALKNNVSTISIPLLEESSVENSEKRKRFIESIMKLHEKYNKLLFSFEAELNCKELLEITSSNNKFFATYDTGNITSYLKNNKSNIYIHNIFNVINNVHLKDRTFEGKTKFPTCGDTNFHEVFKALKDLEYTGLYTLQTARGLTGIEVETISYHKRIFEKIYEESI